MTEYPKIQTVYKRDPATKYKTLLEGEFSLPEFDYLKGNAWIWREKVDGTNIRVMFDGDTITFGGKTDNAQIPALLLNALNSQFLSQIDLFKELFPEGVCFCGEGYGAKIQKGGKYRPDQGFVLFDISINYWWLRREDLEQITEKFAIDIVPIIGIGTLSEMVEMARTGFKSRWGDFLAEGIVATPVVELKARNNERIITKIKHKDFQIYQKSTTPS